MTPAGQDWLDCTLVCLEEHVQDHIPVDTNCDDAMDSAIAAHNDCYLPCSLCSLPPGDIDLVQNTIEGSDLMPDEVLPVGNACLATNERSPLPMAAFQKNCVIKHGGCPQTRLDGQLPDAEEIAQLNSHCWEQTGYPGSDVHPTAAEHSQWEASLSGVLETRGLAVTTGFWEGALIDNPELDGEPVFVREDKKICFDWEDGSPGHDIPVDNHAAFFSSP